MQFELFVAARYLKAKRRQAVIGIITVIISIYYYFKVMVPMYMWERLRELQIFRPDPAVWLGGGIIFLLLFWLGVYPTPLLSMIGRIATLFMQ